MIKKMMTDDHRKCDEPFGQFEDYVSQNKFEEALPLLKDWKNQMLNHFDIEENLLFPKTEEKLGHALPPVFVMLSEHAQIKDLMNRMESALMQQNKNDFLGLSETCMMMIQQHNNKEEQILYTIIVNTLGQAEHYEEVKGRLKL